MRWLYKYKELFISFGLTFCLLSLIFALTGIAPFGEKSILLWDMEIQYVEFFSYLRDCLLGENSLIYTFSSSLGNSSIALFGYYLSSPFNILVLLFEQDQMHICLALITLLKVSTISTTACYYLIKRYSKLERWYAVLLSLAFGLSQYTISQMSNIMWLDGVYLLPFMMLGVYNFLIKKSIKLLSVSIVLSVIFNWYTGYMNCLFIPFYFLYELKICKDSPIKQTIKEFTHFCYIEGLSVLVTMPFFLPVILGLSQGKAVENKDIFSFATNGNLLDVLRGFVIGNGTDFSGLNLFCGTLVLYFIVLYFMDKRILKEKKYTAIMLVFLITGCYFKPLENIWNGLRIASSYYCRFSYLLQMFMIVVAARYLTNIQSNHVKKNIIIFVGGSIISLLLLDYLGGFNPNKLWMQILLIIIFGMGLHANSKHTKILLSMLVIGELGINGFLNCDYHYNQIAKTYSDYVNDKNRSVEKLKKLDNSFYRLGQSKYRDYSSTGLTAYYDESLSYNYSSIEHYSSCFNYNTANFISSLGYSDYADLTIVNEPILSSDSFLGVKYYLSEKDVPGFKQIDSNFLGNQDLYENPYAFSLGVLVNNKNDKEIIEENPFIFQNKLFSSLMDKDIQLFKKNSFDKEIIGSGIVYTTKVIQNSRNPLYMYGRFPEGELNVYIDGEFRTEYQKWLSYAVMNLGQVSDKHIVQIDGLTENSFNSEMEIYYLDLDVFEEVYKTLNDVKIKYDVNNEKVTFDLLNENNKYLLTTIPYDKNWVVKVNGDNVNTYSQWNTFLCIPLVDGQNEIELSYKVPGIKAGVALGGVSFILLFIYSNKMKSHANKNRKSLLDM